MLPSKLVMTNNRVTVTFIFIYGDIYVHLNLPLPNVQKLSNLSEIPGFAFRISELS